MGFDMMPLLASLPDDRRARDRAFAARIVAITTAREGLWSDTLPLGRRSVARLRITTGRATGAGMRNWLVLRSCRC